MLGMNYKRQPDETLSILCIGAHPDDIEIGCGGTILKLLKNSCAVNVTWVVLSANKIRSRETSASAKLFLKDSKEKKILFQDFRDSFFPSTATPIKEFFELLKNFVFPDIIFTHYRHDRHQDHSIVSDLTWQTFRNHLIYEYEVLKYDGDLRFSECFCPFR